MKLLQNVFNSSALKPIVVQKFQKDVSGHIT